jgi:predicted nucleotidyltransferase
MKKDTEILSSFDLKKGLNPKVWVKDNKSTKLKPEIREKLLEIAYEFIEFLGVDIIVSDVHMTGSMANYNWSKYSDFDLHVIVDFDQFPKDQLELYKELFKLKKTLFNSDHNIKIYGYDVELYLQDSNEPHFSTGVYSVIYNKWLTPPKKGDFKADKEVLMSKVNQWTEKIDEVIDSAKGKDLEAALKLLAGFKDKLKKYRQSGLEGGGELSYENLVFKYLRRNGYIEKLFNFENEKVDKELSLDESSSDLRDTINKLDYEEKGSEISSGGEISDEISTAVSEILERFKKVNPNANVKVTGGNDKYHKGMRSNHPKGLAIDLTVEPQSSHPQFISILDEYKKTNPNFSYKNEYINPSMYATAPHFHLQIEGSSPVKKEYEKLLDSESKSEFLEKIKRIAESGRDFENNLLTSKNITYSTDVEDIQIGLQFLGHSLPIWGVDGLFGPETEKAVKSFQEKYGLNKTGKLEKKDLQYLYVTLLLNNFKESDLSKINFEGGYNQSVLDVSPNVVPSDFGTMTNIIINKIEGGYYNPEWHYQSAMGKSGETMFGMDRIYGKDLFNSGEGKEFWRIIDANKSKDVWTHNFNGGDLKEKLIKLVTGIMEEEYDKNSSNYLTSEAKKIVDTNNGLKFHFLYACWNGKGFFKMFANKINQAVSDGITDPNKLLSIAINSRLDSPSMKKSGDKMIEIFKSNKIV